MVDSDNTTARIIRREVIKHFDPQEGSFKQLDIPVDINESKWLISAKSYGSIMKCLYLSCFLTPEDSQKILQYLASSNDQRVRGGVPENIVVANKIGTFSTKTQSDCAIVYAPNRPYLICIMLNLDPNQADTHIKTISKLIYDYVTDTSR